MVIENFLYKSPSERSFTNGIHSFLEPNNEIRFIRQIKVSIKH